MLRAYDADNDDVLKKLLCEIHRGMSYLSSNPYVLNLVPLFDVANPSGSSASVLSDTVNNITTTIDVGTRSLFLSNINPVVEGGLVNMNGNYSINGTLGINGFAVSSVMDVYGGDAYFNQSIYVNSNVHCQNVFTLSDGRFKTNIFGVQGALSTVCELQGVHYTMVGGGSSSDAKQTVGFIAQQIAEVLPEAVNKENPEKWMVDYTRVVPMLVEAVKELRVKVIELEALVKARA